MTKIRKCKKVWGMLLVSASTWIVSPAQTLTTLVKFNGANGALPSMSLTQGIDGNFYGVTENGGDSKNCYRGCGTVFKVSPSGTLTTLHNFDGTDGATPYGAALVQTSEGDLYGTTLSGGGECFNVECGTVFKITPAGKLTTLYRFCIQLQNTCPDGAGPDALVQSTDGSIYGTTGLGGAFCPSNYNCGTIFKITRDGRLTTLYSFCSDGAPCQDGGAPISIIQAADGNFYGTTFFGGSYCDCYAGTIFKFAPLGKLTTLHSFCASEECGDGESPSKLVQSPVDGDFYGTTYSGGFNFDGTFFKITTTGRLTTLHKFHGSDGFYPESGIVLASDGNFYDTTHWGGHDIECNEAGCGTVFKMSPSGVVDTLYSFCPTGSCDSGSLPFAGLVQGTSGAFYGTTGWGGDMSCNFGTGCGTIFKLSTGLAPFVAFVRAAGEAGQTSGILGQGFTGTTSVEFNGIPANFTAVSDTYLKATIPSDATTGYVTVTTSSGVLTSNVPFRVIP